MMSGAPAAANMLGSALRSCLDRQLQGLGTTDKTTQPNPQESTYNWFPVHIVRLLDFGFAEEILIMKSPVSRTRLLGRPACSTDLMSPVDRGMVGPCATGMVGTPWQASLGDC
jgi:hypothetical protein